MDDGGGELSGVDLLRDGGAAPAEAEIHVLEENWQAVQVYRTCQPVWISGMHAPVYAGIAAQEVEASARLHGVPPTDFPDLMAAIDVMVAARQEYEATRRK